MSEQMIAERLGVTPMSYYDLEHDDAEALMSVSLAQLLALSRILGISPRWLLSDEGAPPIEGMVSALELVQRIEDRISRERITIDTFGQQVGWDVCAAL